MAEFNELTNHLAADIPGGSANKTRHLLAQVGFLFVNITHNL
jgi:hypothetical protein